MVDALYLGYLGEFEEVGLIEHVGDARNQNKSGRSCDLKILEKSREVRVTDEVGDATMREAADKTHPKAQMASNQQQIYPTIPRFSMK